LIGLELGSLPAGADLEALANAFRAESSVETVSRKSDFLFYSYGMTLRKDAEDRNGTSLRSMAVDPAFIDLMQMKLIAGRPLPEKHPGDSITQVILNRTALDYLELTPEEAIGKRVLAQIGTGVTEICGVVENFNFQPLYRPVAPFCMHNDRGQSESVLMLRVKEGNLAEQLKTYEEIFKRYYPDELFEPRFADMEVETFYNSERRTNRVAIVFSVLAILVACMGVFGLTAFMAEQRTKEIGIRKVMGAGVGNIVSLFTDSYVKLLLISLVIAIPAAWWIGEQYLQNFAYRISLSWWMFAAAALITVVLTLLTVSVQAVKAAVANPVRAISSSE
jgi:putative ABC transport system permease protein